MVICMTNYDVWFDTDEDKLFMFMNDEYVNRPLSFKSISEYLDLCKTQRSKVL